MAGCRTSQRAVDALLRPYAAAEMECYPVSTAVNNVRNERAECVERVEGDLQGPDVVASLTGRPGPDILCRRGREVEKEVDSPP